MPATIAPYILVSGDGRPSFALPFALWYDVLSVIPAARIAEMLPTSLDCLSPKMYTLDKMYGYAT